jgi:hypothetical protein
MAGDAATLLGWVTAQVPPRLPIAARGTAATTARFFPVRTRSVCSPRRVSVPASATEPTGIELAYETADWKPAAGGCITDALYEGYALQSIRIAGSQTHPTRLVESSAMASVAPPKPSYQPHLPASAVAGSLLSDAQLESVIYAGEAHAGHLGGSWIVDETFDVVSAAPDEAEHSVRFRRGWMLGDGTGAGKGRQVAGIILDNWLKGRRRAVWISKSDKLIEDGQCDWPALGQERLLVTSLARFRQGTPVRLEQGILFATHATLRTDAREERVSRVRQIVDWLGSDFDGAIVFDESHALANAAGGKGERCGLGVLGPVGPEGDLRHLAMVGSASGNALGALRRTAVQQHHACKAVMPRRRRYASAIVREIGCDMAKRRRADSGDPRGAGEVSCPVVWLRSGCGRLRKARASSRVSRKRSSPRLRAIKSRRSPCSPVAASVHLPAAPLPLSGPWRRTNKLRPGVLATSPISQ